MVLTGQQRAGKGARALEGQAVGRGRGWRGVSEAWRRRRCCSSFPPPQAPSPAPSAHARSRLGKKRWRLWAPAGAAGCPPRRRVPAALVPRSSSRTGSPEERVRTRAALGSGLRVRKVPNKVHRALSLPPLSAFARTPKINPVALVEGTFFGWSVLVC